MSDSYWSFRAAGELPDDDDRAFDDTEGASAPTDADPPVWNCATCGEEVPGCACDRRAQEEALAGDLADLSRRYPMDYDTCPPEALP